MLDPLAQMPFVTWQLINRLLVVIHPLPAPHQVFLGPRKSINFIKQTYALDISVPFNTLWMAPNLIPSFYHTINLSFIYIIYHNNHHYYFPTLKEGLKNNIYFIHILWIYKPTIEGHKSMVRRACLPFCIFVAELHSAR